MASIAGDIAEAFYGPVPKHIADRVLEKLPQDLLEVTTMFNETFM